MIKKGLNVKTYIEVACDIAAAYISLAVAVLRALVQNNRAMYEFKVTILELRWTCMVPATTTIRKKSFLRLYNEVYVRGSAFFLTDSITLQVYIYSIMQVDEINTTDRITSRNEGSPASYEQQVWS